eukprot:CAMPEP_0198683518 /NCGR_PEP_ID=MMETSP1468-20131203/10766_1 /TAXON_ID=1461545 /ORGANISM="Mantoniella sp, Strain CCMP1436" /LENGTH=86 /DNA_ID=CAMNT_0044427593 /DNA_START=1 /DNA_END=257 /DNA_ORIENTATION=+
MEVEKVGCVAIGVAAWQRVLKRQGEEGKASYIEGGSADGSAVQSTAHAASTVSWERGRAVRAVPRESERDAGSGAGGVSGVSGAGV